MKAYFLLGTLLLILVGPLLKNSPLIDEENPCWAGAERASSGIRRPWHQTGVSQNTELFIKMQRLNSSVMVSSQGHELGGRDAYMLYLCDRP